MPALRVFCKVPKSSCKMGQVAACPWSQGLAAAQGKQSFSRKGAGGSLPSTPGNVKILGKLALVGEGGTENRSQLGGGGEGGGRGAELILGHCVCVCRRKRLIPEDGLDKGLSQSPSQVLGWDEEQKERCVMGPGALDLPGFTSWVEIVRIPEVTKGSLWVLLITQFPNKGR